MHRTSALDALFDELFNYNISNVAGTDTLHNRPWVNITEADEAFHIEVAAPGLDKNDFNVEIHKNRLTVSAGSEEENTMEGGKYTKREFDFSTFRRTFRLPKSVDQEKIEAQYANGILTLILPKKEEVVEAARSRTIAVE